MVVTPVAGAEQSTLISSAVDASGGNGGGAIIELGDCNGTDCSTVLFPSNYSSDQSEETNASQDTLNAR